MRVYIWLSSIFESWISSCVRLQVKPSINILCLFGGWISDLISDIVLIKLIEATFFPFWREEFVHLYEILFYLIKYLTIAIISGKSLYMIFFYFFDIHSYYMKRKESVMFRKENGTMTKGLGCHIFRSCSNGTMIKGFVHDLFLFLWSCSNYLQRTWSGCRKYLHSC